MNKTTLDDQRYYRTTDIALAAALSLFYPLETIDRHDTKKAEFIFKRDPRKAI